MRFLFLLLPLAFSCAHAADFFCGFEQDAAGWEAGGGSRCALSKRHFKEGVQSLQWSWKAPGARLSARFPEQKTGRSRQNISHFGFWLYSERPLAGRLHLDLFHGRERVASCWYNLHFTGWRVLGLNTETLGLPAGTLYDRAILRPEAGRGVVWIDAVMPCFLSAPVQADNQQPWARKPELLLRPPAETAFSDRDVSLNRSYLPPYVRAGAIPAPVRAQMRQLAGHYLGASGHGGRAYPSFPELENSFRSLGVSEENGAIAGPPLALSRNGFLTPPGSLDFNGRFVPVFLQLAAACHLEKGPSRARAEDMYLLLCRYLLDQGFQEGNNNFGWIGNGYDFRHYPPAVFAHLDLLRRAGLLEAMAKSVAWLCMGNEMLSERPYSSCDQFYNYSAHLPAAILALPDEGMRYQRLRAFKRYLDITIGTNPLPFGTDGTAHHHTGHHLSYGGYTPPAMLHTQILPFRDTVFRIAPDTQQKLRTYARACAFQTMHNSLAPNLYLRSGAPLSFSAAPAALRLARLGSPDGKESIDRDMAAVYLDSLDGEDTADAREFRAMGIQPVHPSGHWSLNRAATGLHRRADWQAAAVGMCREHRGLEIYGWTESNNYGRYSRNGSLFLTIGRDTGWRREGWNWNHWPGATNPVRAPHDLYEGYALFSNANDMAAGTELGADGIWGNDFHCRDIAFKKSYFFFGHLVAALTTGIRPLDSSGSEIVTTLFQQSCPSIPPSSAHGKNIRGKNLAGAAPATENAPGEDAASSTFLTDPLGNIYWLPSKANLRHSCQQQEWTYFTRSDLVNPADNPCLDIRRKLFCKQPLSANASFYQPTRGTFELAYLTHGANPSGASARYVVCISPDAREAASFRKAMCSQSPPLVILRQDDTAHIVYHPASRTTGYVVFAPCRDLPAPLKSVNLPGVVMVRDRGASYQIAAASGDPHRKEPFEISFGDGANARLDPAYPLSATAEIPKPVSNKGLHR